MSKKIESYENGNGELIRISKNNYLNDYFKKNLNKQCKTSTLLLTTWLDIDLGQLSENYKKILKLVGPEVGVISVLKSNAYGHGLIPIAKTLEKLKTSKIGVASIEEIQLLRKNNIMTPILLLYPPLKTQLKIILDLNAEITIDNYELLLKLNNLAKSKNKIIKIHIQINTGLNRYGIEPSMAKEFILKTSKLKNIKIEGIWTHFTDADNDNKLTITQFNKFIEILKQISIVGIKIPFIHCANSAAISNFKKSYNKNMFLKIMPNSKILVRPGCLLYGTYEKKKNRFWTNSIISSMTSHITNIIKIEKGSYVGYFKKYISKENSIIATIPVGWGNSGYLSEKFTIMIKNKYSNNIGLVSSNNLAVDITNIKNCKVGQRVFLIKKNDINISIENVAKNNNKFLNYFISSLGAVRKVYFTS